MPYGDWDPNPLPMLAGWVCLVGMFIFAVAMIAGFVGQAQDGLDDD